MTRATHEFDHCADIRAALADPALVPEPPTSDGGPAGASVAWLRATVARFSSGDPHRRRRALVEAELARLEPAGLWSAAGSAAGSGPRSAAQARLDVVRVLAEALGMPAPGAVAEAVAAVARTYFGGEDAASDRAVAWLAAQLAPGREDDAALEAAASRIGLLVQACAATATLVESAARCPADVPLARVLREVPPVPAMRRIAGRATRVAGREIAEGDVVILDLVTANGPHPVPLTFGAPPRVCPGRAHAMAIATGLLGRPLTAFARLHHQATPLLLPDARNHAEAAALTAQGFPAVGITSQGRSGGAGATAEATVALARRIGLDAVLFTVDVGGGFSDAPADVAELARTLCDAGAAGINLGDGRPDRSLAPVELHAAKIASAKAAAPALFVNARTDTHLLGRHVEQTEERLARYEQAGADGVFVPGLSDPAAIAALTATVLGPLDILYVPGGPAPAELAALGVRRISCPGLQ